MRSIENHYRVNVEMIPCTTTATRHQGDLGGNMIWFRVRTPKYHLWGRIAFNPASRIEECAVMGKIPTSGSAPGARSPGYTTASVPDLTVRCIHTYKSHPRFVATSMWISAERLYHSAFGDIAVCEDGRTRKTTAWLHNFAFCTSMSSPTVETASAMGTFDGSAMMINSSVVSLTKRISLLPTCDSAWEIPSSLHIARSHDGATRLILS